MRPTPTESLAGIRRMLANVVVPLIEDEYGTVQLGHALLALDDLTHNWADEVLWLIESADTLDTLLHDLKNAHDDGHLDWLPDTVPNAIDRALKTAGATPRHPTYDELTSRANALREGLSSVVRAGFLEEDTSELAARVRDYLREHVGRLS